MKTIVALTISMTSLALQTTAHAEAMCKPGEQPIFNCELKASVASLCLDASKKIFVYRNGTTGKLNLQVPRSDDLATGSPFHFSYAPYSGGGEAHVRFRQGAYNYYLYDRTYRTDDGPDFSAGIVIFKNDRKIANLACTNDASIHQQAYMQIPQETYRDISAP
ncbi:hypothetical protein [Paraburkholderia sp. J94]|uniref:hypothetical protein n=1 Tax=Paraburkholderia sp. J94 TaxID=2805441 RepID=UPI002AB04C5C|nr:hypothetical protein [Paraburkholderia sp. J94]